MWTLWVSIVALVIGPLLFRVATGKRSLLFLLDGFIFVAITGLVVLFILPESMAAGGVTAAVFLVVAMVVPSLVEHRFHRQADRTHATAIAVGLLGFGLHALIDGAALAAAGTSTFLPAAVILHRIPVGLAVWWLLKPGFPGRAAEGTIATLGVATVAGYALGPPLLANLDTQAVAWFQALVAGSLLHVVFHQPHLGQDDCLPLIRRRFQGWLEGTGAVLGLVLLAVLFAGEPFLAAPARALNSDQVVSNFFHLALESAPALLLAYWMAGLLNAFLPSASIRWMGQGSRWRQSMKGMAVGLPFPICSCGVVPLYRTLIVQGAPVSAALAFLVATPELGIDAVLLSVPLLGTEMTVIRVLAAALVAFVVGAVVSRALPAATGAASRPPAVDPAGEGQTLGARFRQGMKNGFGEMVDHTAPWIVAGLMVAAIAQPLLSGGWLASIPDALDVPLFALLGMPVYVCASGATPLVAVLLFHGVSPGAALAFLLTGPATNITTFGLLSRLHGKRLAVFFTLAMVVLPVTLGFLVNWMLPGFQPVPLDQLAEEGVHAGKVLALTALAGVYLFSLLRRGARKFVAELLIEDERVITASPHIH